MEIKLLSSQTSRKTFFYYYLKDVVSDWQESLTQQSLHGLQQGSCTHSTTLEFHQCMTDVCECVCFRSIEDRHVAITDVHVDDIFAVGKDRCERLSADLNGMIAVKKQGESE